MKPDPAESEKAERWPGSPDSPYLSVVCTTRNDDHGGDPLKRLQAFINTFAAQCRRTSLSAEVIIVEWNPPADKPRVSELCRVPPETPFALRFVEVPAELHQRLRFSSVLPLFQMIAKNVGIRRARGRFILATNIDIILSTELVERLASSNLVPGRLYRVDRHDIEPDFPVEAGLTEQMTYCQTHQIRVHTRTGTHPVDPFGGLRTLDFDIVAPKGFALGSGWHTREGDHNHGFYRWAEPDASVTIDRTLAPYAGDGAVLDVEVEPNPYQPGSWVELEIADGGRQLTRRRASRRARLRVPLDDGVARHDIVIRVLDSSRGSAWLPLCESRTHLSYRVWHVGVAIPPRHQYDTALWRPAFAGPLVRQTDGGIEVITDPGNYSDGACFGSFETPADGLYEFLLEYELTEGRVLLSVKSDEDGRVLPSTVVDVDSDGSRFFSLTVELPRGVKFSLLVSNNRPEGGASTVILRQVLGSVPLERLRRDDLDARFATLGRVIADGAEVIARPFHWLKAKVSSLESARAKRFHPTIVESSPRVRELETRIASLLPLTDLEPLARVLKEHRFSKLFQNACGDFQLMAREHWFALRGYPEFEMFSMSIDGLFEAIAAAAGIQEHVFDMPLCIYHFEHEKGSGWSPEGEALLKKRIAESGISWLDNDTVHIWASYMRWLGRPMIFNGPDWGLGDADLRETTIRAVADEVS
jgi:hypothetical protein